MAAMKALGRAMMAVMEVMNQKGARMKVKMPKEGRKVLPARGVKPRMKLAAKALRKAPMVPMRMHPANPRALLTASQTARPKISSGSRGIMGGG